MRLKGGRGNGPGQMSTRSGTIPNRRPTETLKTGPVIDAFLPDQPKRRRRDASKWEGGR